MSILDATWVTDWKNDFNRFLNYLSQSVTIYFSTTLKPLFENIIEKMTQKQFDDSLVADFKYLLTKFRTFLTMLKSNVVMGLEEHLNKFIVELNYNNPTVISNIKSFVDRITETLKTKFCKLITVVELQRL